MAGIMTNMNQQNQLVQARHILTERKRNRRRRRVARIIWVRGWIARRPELGLYDYLMVELRNEDQRAFQNFMRMPPAMYDKIVQRLTPALTKETPHWRAPLAPGLNYAITLRHLASGSKYREMQYAWRVPHNTIRLVVCEVCEAIVHEYAQEMLSPPETEAQWRQLADDWYHRWNFPYVIGAIDGKHIACKAPANTRSDYFNYKGFFSVILLAVVSSDYKFLWIDVTRCIAVTIAVGIILSVVDAYPTGAPVTACVSMVPSGHDKTTTSGSPPFKVNVSMTSYKPGSAITGTIFSPTGVKFKGFFIQARSTLNQTTTPFGQFIVTDNLTHTQCGQDNKQGLTHSNNNNKTSVMFTWKAPDQYTGDIIFRVTIVEEFSPSRYWLDVTSVNISDCSLHTNATGCDEITTEVPYTQPTSIPISSSSIPSSSQNTPSSIQNDPGCGVNKGCFSDCANSGCTYLATWQADEDKDEVVFDLKMKLDSTQNVWVAIGISPIGKMSGTNVIACLAESEGVVIQSSINKGYVNQVFKNSQLGISATSGQVSNGIVQCTATRKKSLNDTDFLSLSNKYYVLVGHGPVLSGFLALHPYIPVKSQGKVDFLSTGVEKADNSASTLIKLHASLMIVAWVFLSSIGVVAARHFKEMFHNELYLGVRAWFLVHRPVMVLAALCVIGGVVAIFVEVKGFSKNTTGPDYTASHPILGLVVTGLTLLNPIMAMFRPSPESKSRYIFNWAHFIVGSAAHIIAILNIFFGMKLDKSKANKGTIYIMIAYTALFMTVQLILEIRSRTKKSDKMATPTKIVKYGSPDGLQFEYGQTNDHTDAAPTSDFTTSYSAQLIQSRAQGHSNSPSGHILFVHGLLMLGLAGFLIAVICLPIDLI